VIIHLLKSNRHLLFFTFFNLLDKAIIVLLPFVVLNLFHEQEKYIQLEYIISTVNIIATVSDLGLNGYLFFLYQQSVNKTDALGTGRQISEVIFMLLVLVGAGVILFHSFVSPLHFLVLFIVIRALFNYLITFLTSYFRLVDKPVRVLYISLMVNVSSLLLLMGFFAYGQPVTLWLIFTPQLLFTLYFMGRIASTFDYSTFSLRSTFQVILKALEFSWPSIIQVFLMVYMANYGKVNALDKLPKEDAVFLGYSLRFCMLIQLAHASLVGFYSKSILAGEDLFNISAEIMKLYAVTLIVTAMFVISAMFVYQAYIIQQDDLNGRIVLMVLFSMYTLLWCFYSYLEMYFARINRNRIKLYLTFVILFVFVLTLKFLPFELVHNIAWAMFTSIFAGLIGNILVLKRLKFRLC
jgi:hypothetical protein